MVGVGRDSRLAQTLTHPNPRSISISAFSSPFLWPSHRKFGTAPQQEPGGSQPSSASEPAIRIPSMTEWAAAFVPGWWTGHSGTSNSRCFVQKPVLPSSLRSHHEDIPTPFFCPDFHRDHTDTSAGLPVPDGPEGIAAHLRSIYRFQWTLHPPSALAPSVATRATSSLRQLRGGSSKENPEPGCSTFLFLRMMVVVLMVSTNRVESSLPSPFQIRIITSIFPVALNGPTFLSFS